MVGEQIWLPFVILYSYFYTLHGYPMQKNAKVCKEELNRKEIKYKGFYC